MILTKWVDNKERQPSEEGNYLVCWSDGEICVLDYFIHENAQGWNYTPREVADKITVTHWMRLPEAPKPDTL